VTNGASAANDDVGAQGISGTVGGVGNGAGESAITIAGDLSGSKSSGCGKNECGE